MSSAPVSSVQICKDTTDLMDLYPPFHFYLKPLASLHISVQLPQLKSNSNKSVSSYEVMEKIKHLMKPEEFTSLKMVKGTVEFIRFEGEVQNQNLVKSVCQKLDHKTFKLSGFSETLKVRCVEAKLNYPSRHDWDTYFRDNKNMNEMKAGERPDTMYINNLPCAWFAHKKEVDKTKPCDFVIRKVFGTFGEITEVDIPILDPYRMKMPNSFNGIRSFNYGKDYSFEAYIQYKEYMDFVNAMTALRGMKMAFKEGSKTYATNIKVDFDRTKHLSEDMIRRREVERVKLMEIEREDKQKQNKKLKMEEIVKEKARMLVEKLSAETIHDLYEEKNWKHLKKKSKKKKKKHSKKEDSDSESSSENEENSSEEMDRKIAEEERKLLMAQRNLECIRLLDYLFSKIQESDLTTEQASRSRSRSPARQKDRKRRKSSPSKRRSKRSRSRSSSSSENDSGTEFRNRFSRRPPWQNYRQKYQRYFRGRSSYRGRGPFRGRGNGGFFRGRGGYRSQQQRSSPEPQYDYTYYDQLNDAYDRYFSKLVRREAEKSEVDHE